MWVLGRLFVLSGENRKGRLPILCHTSIFNSSKSIRPHLQAFRTICADIYAFAVVYQLFSEIFIRAVRPYTSQTLLLEIPHCILRIFIETAWYYFAIPGNYTAMPQFPAFICHFVFDCIQSVSLFSVPGIFINCWNQITTILVIIDLSGF